MRAFIQSEQKENSTREELESAVYPMTGLDLVSHARLHLARPLTSSQGLPIATAPDKLRQLVAGG
jgi:hypothetical protein